MEEAYREYVTTSPSYHLLASADAAVRTLAARGEDELGRAIERTLRAQGRPCARALPDLDRMDDPAWIAGHGDRVGGCDLVKTTVGLSRYDLSGYDVARALVERGIVIEKAGVHTITLITTFQLGPDAVPDTVDALHDILAGHCLPGRRARADAGQPVQRDRRPAGDPPLRRAPLREVDRPRGRRCARRWARSPPRRSRSIRPASR